MGIFDKVFKSQRDISKEEIQEVPWKALTEEAQLEKLESQSRDKTIAIFKHSTRCGISRMVLNNFERNYDLHEEEDLELYFLDLLANRDISNKVADKFNVRHESPQILIIKNGEVVHHASHQSIEVESLKKHL
ncbi:MAG TPA: bacillithiol system redox-active protein YtxJ [Salinimicrobium catena]|uniref:Bacillithiol system redox-active protein YtxJ n=1 Tax=Salinimicrobium catena TaxID=390640 RepID=A0A7C2R0M8_9FLAO|nr:bacillithiol system redox-active protein YtxJ [Salinimicrobium catena]